MASTCIHGKWLIFPAKQLNFSERQKNVQFFSEAVDVFWIFTLLEVPRSSGWLWISPAVSAFPMSTEHSPDKVRNEQHCWVADDENKAERSRASGSAIVTGSGIDLDLLIPYLVIFPLDIFLFSFENVDSLLERKMYKHYTFHCQKKGFVIWYTNSFNYCSNFTAWGGKGQIC